MNILAYVHLRNIYRSTGVGRASREWIEQLAGQPNNTLRILADRGDAQRVLPQVGSPWTSFDYRYFPHETSLQQLRWLTLNGPAAESFWPEADIVFCTAESYVPCKRARLVMVCHDMQIFEQGVLPEDRHLRLQRLKWQFMFRKLARKVDLFVTVSHFSAERLAHFFPAAAPRIAVVPNAVSSAFFQQPSEQSLRVLDNLFLRNRPYVLLPGGLHFRKNADLVLKAWPLLRQRCPELTLVVPNHNTPRYADLASGLPGIVLAGFQEEDRFAALYACAEAAWFPSRYEGFGMPVLEAMASGTPVVTSNVSALPETAGTAAAALLATDHVADHVNALEALHRSPARRAKFSALGKAHAVPFTWQSSAEQMTQCFHRTLATPKFS